MQKHYKITISGKVQGVCYRANTQAEALKLGLKGFVRNEPNGDVYTEAEGTAGELENFIEWLRKGPDRAVVKNVAVKEGEWKGYGDFIIKK